MEGVEVWGPRGIVQEGMEDRKWITSPHGQLKLKVEKTEKPAGGIVSSQPVNFWKKMAQNNGRWRRSREETKNKEQTLWAKLWGAHAWQSWVLGPWFRLCNRLPSPHLISQQ